MTLYLLKYNNYYNRILKTEKSLNDYLAYLEFEAPDYNFNPGDGITTAVELGSMAPYSGTANYCLVVDKYGEIVSRWFVMEQGRVRAGQYGLTLRRDLMVDYYNDWYNVPAYIERGYLDIDDPFIFAKDNTDFNQIKKQEVLLKDPTECPWVVGYVVAPKPEDSPIDVEYGISDMTVDYSTAILDNWDYKSYISSPYKLFSKAKLAYRLGWDDGDKTVYITLDTSTKSGNTKTYNDIETEGAFLVESEDYFTPIKDALVRSASDYWEDLEDAVVQQYSVYDDTSKYLEIKNLQNKILLVTNEPVTGGGTRAAYYRITVNELFNQKIDQTSMSPASRLGVMMNTLLAQAKVAVNATYDTSNSISGTANDESFNVEYYYKSIGLTLTEINPTAGLNFQIPKTRKILRDAPYCMFCMPYSDTYQYTDVNMGNINRKTANKTNALSLAAAISASLGEKLYDIQLLPFCPISKVREFGVECWISTMVPDVDFTLIDQAQQIMFWADTSIGSFDIQYNYPIYNVADSIEFKVNSQTKFVRLCSPNYSGVFEFSPHKNGGIAYFNVDYQYKPWSPYIHMNPNFGGLYGEDFNDGRGLILGGDFSLTTLSNHWTNYQIQNKNYELIFKSQIELMEYEKKMGLIQDIFSAVSGTVSGTASGGMAGAFIGGGKGAMIGAGVAGVVSAGAGIADVILNNQMRKKTIAYTEEQHELALGNIKALPDTLTKISAINNNNKLFPFLEIYEATPEEMEAYRTKIIYDGMTINRIGTMKDIIQNKPTTINLGFFKAQVIRPADIMEDYHLANELAVEINKGVYM